MKTINNYSLFILIVSIALLIGSCSLELTKQQELKTSESGEAQVEIKTPKEYSRTDKSGVLLGLRSVAGYYLSEATNERNTDYSFRTLWIRNDGEGNVLIDTLRDIIVPREKSFWRVYTSNLTYQDKIIRNKLYQTFIYSQLAKETKSIEFSFEDVMSVTGYDESDLKCENYLTRDLFFDHHCELLFVGTDYLSLANNEYGWYGGASSFSLFSLEMYHLDSVQKNHGVGNTSDTIFNHYLNHESSVIESCGLIRQNGHWVVRARYHTTPASDWKTDETLEARAPTNVVGYDELLFSWNEIRQYFPDAIDAVSSPNKDILVIIERDADIYVHEIKNDEINKINRHYVKRENKEVIVSVQWAMGKYVDKWNKELEQYFVESKE